MKGKIDCVGIGVSTVDFVNVVDHFPSAEEVQKSVHAVIEGGGPVATAMVALARLGAHTAMIDTVGNDWRGKYIIDGFRKEKVNTKYIKIFEGHSSSFAVILVRKSDGARTIIFTPGSVPELSPDYISKEIISRADFIHVNGRHFAASVKACELAKNCGTKISFDGGSHRFDDKLKKLVKLSDVAIVAKNFAFNYSGTENIESSAKCILKDGPGIVVITNGENGSFLFTNDINGYHQKAFLNDNTIDTTGCGDSFHGAFLFGLINRKNIYEAIKFASAVASINSTQLGGRTALPNLNEAENFLINKKELK